MGVEVQSVSNGKSTHQESIAPFTPYPHSQATSLGMRLLHIFYEFHFWTRHLQIEGGHHYKQGCDRGKQIFSNTIFSREPLLCISPPVTSVAVRYLSISVVETVIESLNRIISQIKLFTISVSVDTVLFSDPPDVQKYQICSHPESASESLNLLGQEVLKISNIRKGSGFICRGGSVSSHPQRFLHMLWLRIPAPTSVFTLHAHLKLVWVEYSKLNVRTRVGIECECHSVCRETKLLFHSIICTEFLRWYYVPCIPICLSPLFVTCILLYILRVR